MTILSDSEKSRLQEIISKTTGPAPWYWKSFPVVASASGKQYEWVHHGEEGQLAHLVTLHETGKTNDPLLALNIYCTPFEIGEGRFGIWCPDGRNMLRVVAFGLEGLKPFVFEEIVGWFKQSTERIFAKVEPAADFEFSAELNEGMQELGRVSEPLRGVKEASHDCPAGSDRRDGTRRAPSSFCIRMRGWWRCFRSAGSIARSSMSGDSGSRGWRAIRCRTGSSEMA